MRSDCLLAAVGNFPGNVHHIAAALEGQDLGHLGAIGSIGFQSNLQFITAFSQLVGAGNTAELAAMRRQTVTDQAGLNHVLMLGIQQQEVLVLIIVFLVVQQLETDQIAALQGDGGLDAIRGDGEGLGGIGGRNRRRNARGGSDCTCLQRG